MKGYVDYKKLFKGMEPYEPVTEMTLVGCRGCKTTWSEMQTHYTGARINSASMIYDYCDNCMSDEQREFLAELKPTQPEESEEL